MTESPATKRWVAWLRKLDRTPKPPCFKTEAQWTEWVASAGDASLKHKGPLPVGHCSDCLPDYQARMEFEGKCTRTDIRFVKVGPGYAFEGRRGK